jgi:hypothetical protein
MGRDSSIFVKCQLPLLANTLDSHTREDSNHMRAAQGEFLRAAEMTAMTQ